MSENLSNFLVDLASDPDRIALFVANPMGELDRSSLTAEEREAVITRDGSRIRQALGLSPGRGIQAGGGGRKRKGARKGAKKGPKKPTKKEKRGGRRK